MSVQDTIKLIHERSERELDDLKIRSKKLSELVVEKLFYVGNVLSQSFANKVSPISEIQIGGRSPSYDTGYSQHIELEVYPVDNVNTRKIIFNGNSIVNGGDLILAKIPLYETKEVYSGYISVFDYSESTKKFFLPRDFEEQEMAIEIGILDSKNYKHSKIPGRIERSVEYSNFFK